VSENERLPQVWSTIENVEWVAEIPGRGWSSPIVTDGKVIVTTVVTEGESKEPQTGTDFSNDFVAELTQQGLSQEEVIKRVTERDIELPGEVALQYQVHCLSLETGEQLWKQEFHRGQPPGGRHHKNSFASETPVTDGERVYIYIANLGLFAYDLDGNQVWKTALEPHPIYLDFGTGSSPVLHGDQLIIVADNEERSYIAAYDKQDGQQLWLTEREPPRPESGPSPKSGWVTPYIWENELRTEIVTMAPGAVISYDLQGKELWRMTGVTVAPAASSFASDGMLLVNGGRGQAFFAVRPGASGAFSPGETGQLHELVAWSRPRTGTYIPSAVAYKHGLYVINDKGVLSRIDTGTGEESYKTRVEDGANFTASPWAYNDRVFCLSEQGDTYVIAAGDTFELVHVNSLGDFAMSTPAIVDDRLLIRTEQRLYSIRQ
jgi:outer membrane protein assembly factor BamB